MLDARFICGDRKLSEKFIENFISIAERMNQQNIENTCTSERKKSRKQSTVYLQALDKEWIRWIERLPGIMWMVKVKLGNRGLEEPIRRKYLTEHEASSFSQAYSFLYE